MGTALLLVDNLFSTAQYPNHTLTAEEEASGFEVERVQNGRRRSDDHWESTTTNSDTWIKVQCDRPRAANCIVFDRGHNWNGRTVTVQASGDDTTYQDVFATATIPASPTPGRPDAPDGVQTMEGAWIRSFDLDAALHWRVFLDAGGTGVVPQLVGVWLGLALEVTWLDLPAAQNQSIVTIDASPTPAGWRGSQLTGRPRQGTIALKLESFAAASWMRVHLEENFGTPGRPMWIVRDRDAAHFAVLGTRTPEIFGLVSESGWLYEQIAIPWREHEPRFV